MPLEAPPTLEPAEYEQIRRWLYETSGIQLRAGKEALVAARLQRHVISGGHRSYRDLFEKLRRDQSGEILTSVLDSLTTNHTGFLRERRHFDFLTDHIAPQRGMSSLRIWSAACSTGQEPYSIACALLSKPPKACTTPPQILASDLSTRVLALARAATYPESQCTDVPLEWKQRFFSSHRGTQGIAYTVKPEVSRLVTFRQVNLINPFPGLGPFDVIFCRNVMLYFDQATQARLVDRLTSCLAPGGYLLIGHSESLPVVPPPLSYVQPATYRKGS